jgi:hypothetical protein
MIANYEITGEWFGRLNDVVEYIEENGYKVEECNAEYITFYNEDDDDTEYVARLGGTPRTIYIESIKEY